MDQLILTTVYLGPVQYYTKFFESEQVFIEQYDNYRKQTYRNRCNILGANGPLVLTVPVVKEKRPKTLVKDIRIDYATQWQKNHWRSIFSAYNSSPFFEYYETDFMPFYEKRWKFLCDFNMALHKVVADLLELNSLGEFTNEYAKNFEGIDCREVITPKKDFRIADDCFDPVAYTQTFGEKFGFVPNLSIIDLLFNCGPEARLILEQSNA